MQNVLAILLAGGAGERLYPLTRDTAKPAVPFGGAYRIIDFTLSNCINSDVRRILILTQYKSLELIRHIRDGWNILSPELGEYIEVIPPMKRVHSDWYQGTADAVFQNFQSIEAEAPEAILMLSGDHIYKMDYGEMVDWHRAHNADITLATIQVPPSEAGRFGVLEIADDYAGHRLRGKAAARSPGPLALRPFHGQRLHGHLHLQYRRPAQGAPRGRAGHRIPPTISASDVIPRLLKTCRVIAYDFRDLNAKQSRYWRDVGTLDAYYEANMDLVSVSPEFNLYDQRWPIRTKATQQPPAKFVFAQKGRRMGLALDSIVSAGCIVSGGRVLHSVLSPGVRVNSYCEVEYSILMPGRGNRPL